MYRTIPQIKAITIENESTNATMRRWNHVLDSLDKEDLLKVIIKVVMPLVAKKVQSTKYQVGICSVVNSAYLPQKKYEVRKTG